MNTQIRVLKTESDYAAAAARLAQAALISAFESLEGA